MEIASSGEKKSLLRSTGTFLQQQLDDPLLWAASDAEQSLKQEDRKYSYTATTSSFMTLLQPSFIQSEATSAPKLHLHQIRLNPQLPDSGLGEGSSRFSGEGALSSQNNV